MCKTCEIDKTCDINSVNVRYNRYFEDINSNANDFLGRKVNFRFLIFRLLSKN